MTPEQIQKLADGLPPSCMGKDHEEVVAWLAKQHIALQQQVNALAAGLGNVTRCPECGSRSLRWDYTVRARHAVPDGRLRLNEVSGLFYLGCEECSETVIRVSDDDVTKLLNQLRQPEEKGHEIG